MPLMVFSVQLARKSATAPIPSSSGHDPAGCIVVVLGFDAAPPPAALDPAPVSAPSTAAPCLTVFTTCCAPLTMSVRLGSAALAAGSAAAGTVSERPALVAAASHAGTPLATSSPRNAPSLKGGVEAVADAAGSTADGTVSERPALTAAAS